MTQKLIPIGTVKEVVSDNYGTYRTVMVAHLDLRRLRDADEFMRWVNKYHPKTYFVGYGWEVVSPSIDDGTMQIYLPLAALNVDWKSKNPDCLYMRNMKGRRVKGLPIGVDEKQFVKWVGASAPALTDFLSHSSL
jgi:hypothetical protein